MLTTHGHQKGNGKDTVVVSPQTEPEDSSHPSILLACLLTMNHGSISHEYAIFLFLKKCPSITSWDNENFLSFFVRQLIALFLMSFQTTEQEHQVL